MPALPTPSPAPPEYLQWRFSYEGFALRADGIVTTHSERSPDGTYRIVKVEGRRNRRDILDLAPDGEVVTLSGGALFSDNRLWAGAPYLSQSGFTFRTSRGQVFNVCYSGPYEGCGEDGYYEFNQRSQRRAVEFRLEPIGKVTDMALAMQESLGPAACRDTFAPTTVAWQDLPADHRDVSAVGMAPSLTADASSAVVANVPTQPASTCENSTISSKNP